MEKKKNIFGDIKSMLTRDQMKQIKGGSGASWGSCMDECAYGSQCSSGQCILARCSNGTFFICQ
ncbi:hypothetical protein [uncultured Mucilaginibacter sp.]|uniref:hypothetical protein n=1 Tax=uncultured Mucilaginibacter sp. TaxID=797541 RepID=UPI002601BECA|nr:hypothetical protein [uncultured Mucilaginibacter sp.]